jgi:hypothetical protein
LDKEDADLIIKAVNLFPELVKVLEGMLSLHNAESSDGPPSAWPERARAVLKLAKAQAWPPSASGGG